MNRPGRDRPGGPLGGRLPPLLWLAALAAALAWIGVRALSGPVVNVDILGLLPKTGGGWVDVAVAGGFQRDLEKRVALLVEAPDRAAARTAARTAHARLDAGDLFAELTLERANPRAAVGALYGPHRFALLAPAWRARLEAGDAAGLAQDVLGRLTRPAAGVTSAQIAADPLLTMTTFFEGVAEPAGALELDDGMLAGSDGGAAYVLLTGTLAASPFSLTTQAALTGALADLRREIAADGSGTRLLAAGVVFHAAAGAEKARQEISVVGAGTLVGIVLLFVAVFRAARPLLLTVLAIGAGCVFGFAAAAALFGGVHMLVLVFGASLVGISVDYALHYFCEQFADDPVATPRSRLRRVLPGMTMGLLSSVIGFAGLAATDLPVMRQAAVFSSVGLVGAFCTVAAIFPLLATTGGAPTRWPVRAARGGLDAWRSTAGRAAAMAFGLAALVYGAYAATTVTADDSLQSMQPLDPALQAADARLEALAGRRLAQQYFIVSGPDTATTLARQDQLAARLRATAPGGAKTYFSIADVLPSPATQAANRAAIQAAAEGEDALLARVADAIGLPERIVATYRADLAASAATPPLSLEAFLASPLAAPYRLLWRGCDDQGCAVVVALRGPIDRPALRERAAEIEGVAFIDHPSAVSAAFERFRRQAVLYMTVAAVIVAAALAWRYGPAGMLRVLAPPAVGVAAAFGFLALTGDSFSLFNAMALFLVVGIGMDFGIFFREAGGLAPPTYLAVTMSTATTLLAFGLLAFSSTPAVSAFGATVGVGIFVAFLLAPAAAATGAARATRSEGA